MFVLQYICAVDESGSFWSRHEVQKNQSIGYTCCLAREWCVVWLLLRWLWAWQWVFVLQYICAVDAVAKEYCRFSPLGSTVFTTSTSGHKPYLRFHWEIGPFCQQCFSYRKPCSRFHWESYGNVYITRRTFFGCFATVLSILELCNLFKKEKDSKEFSIYL